MPENADIAVLTIADADALREHLDTLNDAGIDYKAAGMDARGEAFLITLDGPYAEVERVFYGNPWDSQVDYGTPRWCNECSAHAPSVIDSLRFPVAVLTRLIPRARRPTMPDRCPVTLYETVPLARSDGERAMPYPCGRPVVRWGLCETHAGDHARLCGGCGRCGR